VLLADSLIVTVYYLFVLGGVGFVFNPWQWDAGGGGISGGFVYVRGAWWGAGWAALVCGGCGFLVVISGVWWRRCRVM